jgi:hypothetical protein
MCHTSENSCTVYDIIIWVFDPVQNDSRKREFAAYKFIYGKLQ